MDNNMSFLDMLTILSFIIGIENLDLNIKQSEQIDQHLSIQDEKLLAKIIAQNEELLEQNRQLLEYLKETNKNDRSL